MSIIEQQQTAVPTGTWRADVVHSSLGFAVRYMGISIFSGAVRPAAEGVEVEGEITIKGITKPAILRGTLGGPVTDPYGNERFGLRLETTIDRTEFGILWNADMPDGTKALANEV